MLSIDISFMIMLYTNDNNVRAVYPKLSCTWRLTVALCSIDNRGKRSGYLVVC